MHTENSTEEQSFFGAQTLDALNDNEYTYLGKDGDDYYFVKKSGDSFIIKKVETLDDSCISDRMREDFDSHEAWVDAVRNGETDESYDRWSEDIDIWEQRDSDDYYECSSQIVKILYDLGLWNDEEYASDNGYYLDEAQTWTISADLLNNLYIRFDTSDKFNQDLRDDIERKYGVNQVEFLPAEPIR